MLDQGKMISICVNAVYRQSTKIFAFSFLLYIFYPSFINNNSTAKTYSLFLLISAALELNFWCKDFCCIKVLSLSETILWLQIINLHILESIVELCERTILTSQSINRIKLNPMYLKLQIIMRAFRIHPLLCTFNT